MFQHILLKYPFLTDSSSTGYVMMWLSLPMLLCVTLVPFAVDVTGNSGVKSLAERNYDNIELLKYEIKTMNENILSVADEQRSWNTRHSDFIRRLESNGFQEETFQPSLTREEASDIMNKISTLDSRISTLAYKVAVNVLNEFLSLDSRLDARANNGPDNSMNNLQSLERRLSLLENEVSYNIESRLTRARNEATNVKEDIQSLNRSIAIVDAELSNTNHDLHSLQTTVQENSNKTDRLVRCVQQDGCVDFPDTREWVTVLVGGRAGGRRNTDAVQVFRDKSTLTLPNYPRRLHSVTMTAIGSKLYGCGGCNGYVCSNLLHTCYVLDIDSKNRQWLESYKLPNTAGGIQDISGANGVLMAVYTSGKISVINIGESGITKLFDSNLEPDLGYCSANDESQTFIVGNKFIFKNSDSSNPHDWQKVATIGEYSVRSCLWFGSELFITGGVNVTAGITVMKEAFVMDVNTFTVRQVGALNVERAGHAMGVIGGRPAVMGGAKDSSTRLNSIETYDHRTDSWQTLDTTLSEEVADSGYVSLYITVN